MEWFEYEEDITQLRKLLLQSPKDVIVKFKLAKALLKKPETIEEAKELLEDLLDTKVRKNVMLELGKLEARYGNSKAARYYLTSLLLTKNRIEALIELGNLEKKNENLEEAIKYYSLIINEKDSSDNSTRENYNLMSLLQLIFIEIHRKNYESAYFVLDKLLQCDEIEKVSSKQLFQISFYLKYKLGKLSDKDMRENGYFVKQLLSYDEDEAISHIKLHQRKNFQKRKHTPFIPELDLESLYEYIKEAISNACPQDYSLCDQYVLDLNFTIGKIKNEDTSIIKVITFSNTKDIITMYPIKKMSYDLEEKKILIKQTATN